MMARPTSQQEARLGYVEDALAFADWMADLAEEVREKVRTRYPDYPHFEKDAEKTA